MSLESGRKLGLTASLIQVIMPVITVIIIVFHAIFSGLSATSTGSNLTFPSFSLIYTGVLALFGILTFIGIILFVVAMHRLSQYYNEPGIFKNVLYGFILNVVGGIAVVAIYFVLILIGSIPRTGTALTGTTLTQFIVGFLAVVVIALVLGIISAVLYMRAFNMLAEKSGRSSFKTVGLLYLLGIVLTIVLIGPLLSWIAWIYAAIAFNSLKPKEPPPLLPPPP